MALRWLRPRQTAKFNGIDPQAWLANVLHSINDQPASRLGELLPWNWIEHSIVTRAPKGSQPTSIAQGLEKRMALQDWKAAVLAPVAELLKRRGFRKNGTRFRADWGEAELRVALQCSPTSDRYHLKATVNLSIHLGMLDHDPTAFAPDGHWRQRIGQFMPGCPDHWWVCQDEETARLAGEQITAILGTAALPEMERLASSEALRALWATGCSPGLTERQRKEFLGKLGK